MSNKYLKPSRWYYILSVLIPVFACLGMTLFVYRNVPKLPGALENVGIENLTQVVVPGSAEINFPKAGAYAVYYEYRSVFDGIGYIRGIRPPSIECQLTSIVTGEKADITPDYVEGNTYATQNNQRVGVLINSITINQPGIYNFSCEYVDGRTTPEIVLAVGPNIVWEFFNIAVKPIAAIILGVPVFVVACGISILIVGIVAYKRHQMKKNLPS